MEDSVKKSLEQFIEEWDDSSERNRAAFIRLREYLAAKAGVKLDFIARPGVTYSLRAAHSGQKERELFVMVDVIEDDPRWLSVCFYADMVADPDEEGDFVPEGLLGADALCLDLDAWDDDRLAYIEARLDEACETASRG